MWHAGLVNSNKLKPVMVRLTQYHPVIHASTSYKLKYAPLNTACITTTSDMNGQTDALELTNLTPNGDIHGTV